MRRLFAIWSAVGLLCGALGCHSCPDHAKMHGRCDCDDGWGYGCHPDMYYHGSEHAVMPAQATPAEPLKALPKEEAK